MRILLSLIFGLAVPLVAVADQLPGDARPIEGAALKAIYSGKSAIWSQSQAYFAPDGAVKGSWKNDKDRGIFWGRWTAKGNEVCMTVQGINATNNESFKNSVDCWKWWTDGGEKPITLWSKAFDNRKLDLKDGHYRDEIDILKSGDRISRSFDPMYRKLVQ